MSNLVPPSGSGGIGNFQDYVQEFAELKIKAEQADDYELTIKALVRLLGGSVTISEVELIEASTLTLEDSFHDTDHKRLVLKVREK